MKKILYIIVIFFGFASFAFSQQPTITKVASNTNPYIGEIFDYTITISGITNLNQLGKVVDDLDTNLEFISTDFNTTSSVYSFFNIWCPTSLSQFSVPTAGSSGQLEFKFPTSNCSGSGGGSFSFKIKVAVKEGACPDNITEITNNVKLFNRSGSVVANSPASTITVNKNTPWVLTKNFRSSDNGYLVYDVRLSTRISQLNINTITSASFTDVFTSTNDCFIIDDLGSQIVYVPNETDLNNVIPVGQITAQTNGLDFAWDLSEIPPSSSIKTSYLFQVKIKNTCTCVNEEFDLNNSATVNLVDICGEPHTLTASANIENVSCLDEELVIPAPAKVCVKKDVELDGNNLNLTMEGCTGKYIITITNCSENYKYTSIKLADFFPSNTLLDIPTSSISISPLSYGSDLNITGTGLVLNTIAPLYPGQSITIEIPFKVITPLPEQFIQNCLEYKITADDGINTPTTFEKEECDIGIHTVPKKATVIAGKSKCTEANHQCGGISNSDFLPGDEVEYALHVYNYGTSSATNVKITDQIPNYMNLIPSSIKVYQLKEYENYIGNSCDITNISDTEDITSSTSKTITGNKITFSLNNNKLDKFTCEGISHYVIKFKVKIGLNAPNGNYTNTFMLEFKDEGDSSNQTQIQYSNPVTLTVNKDNLVMVSKQIAEGDILGHLSAQKNIIIDATPYDGSGITIISEGGIAQNCANKTTRVTYELSAINMGYIPLTFNIQDQISLPNNVSVSSGISNVVYAICTTNNCAPLSLTWQPLVSSGAMTVTKTATTLNINRLTLQPCTMVRIRYTVVYNTTNLNQGQMAEVCNNATFTAGYMSNVVIDSKREFTELPKIIMVQDPVLINQYVEAKSTDERFKIIDQMKKEIKNDNWAEASKIPIIKWPPQTFVPIMTTNAKNCIELRDCLNGNDKGCFTPNDTSSFSFQISGVDKYGKVTASLNIPAGSPKVQKIEFLLADIRMIADDIALSCNRTILGNFQSLFTSLGALNNVNYQYPPTGDFKEKNLILFQSSGFQNLTGNYTNLQFQLPVTNMNCYGNLEFNIVCKVYFEDCSTCFQAVSQDYRATYRWRLPWEWEVIDFEVINVNF